MTGANAALCDSDVFRNVFLQLSPQLSWARRDAGSTRGFYNSKVFVPLAMFPLAELAFRLYGQQYVGGIPRPAYYTLTATRRACVHPMSLTKSAM